MSSPRRILVVGSGGREHALAWRLARDPMSLEVLVAPGNDGMGRSFTRLPIPEHEADALVAACRERGVELVVIGPDAALAAGLADRLSDAGIPVFGPSRAAARLEWSKWFAKEVMAEAGVPTARAEWFERLAPAREALARFAPPWVIKVDGLAAGKGVLVTQERPKAEEFLAACLEGGRYGKSGGRVLIEEFLAGEEASVMAICDGRDFLLLPPARDYKRAHDGDRGLNTGGMGALAPTPRVDAAAEREIGERIVAPVLAAMARRGTPYRGALYCGLMMGEGGPRVVEFNCRFGDPESQVILPLVSGGFAMLLAAAVRGTLAAESIGRERGAAVAVALVDEEYPGTPRGGGVIEGLESLSHDPALLVFHAGTSWEGERWRVRGGRAAYVVARDADVAAARARAYAAIDRLSGSGWRCRHDIAGDGGEPLGPIGASGSPTARRSGGA